MGRVALRKNALHDLTPEARFWFYVPTRDMHGCWEWTGQRQAKGYGLLSVNGRKVRAHRFSYELHIGPIPTGQLVLHRCDNPPCVNPAHLFLGSAMDNTQDAMQKGRLKDPPVHRGSANAQYKLTDEQVAEIRIRYAAGVGQAQLALEYGVHQTRISQLVNYKDRR